MILSTLLVSAALLGGSSSGPLQRSTSTATAEGVEILRRILVESLDKAFTAGDEATGSRVDVRSHEGWIATGPVTTLLAWDQTVQHSRAFHLPDVGLFLALDVSLPVVEKPESKDEPAPGDEPRDDEWEEMRREVRGDSRKLPHLLGTRALRARQSEIDPRAIEQTIDLVLRTVARHSSRIEGLAPQETITVALRLSGRGRAFWSSTLPDGSVEDEGTAARLWTGEEQGDLATAYAFTLAGGASAREQNLVIRVALSELAGYAEGGLERLRQRAQVNRY